MQEVRMKNGNIYIIRRVKATDAKKMVEYANLISAESDFLSFGRDEFVTSLEKDFLEDVLERKNYLFIIAEAEGGVIGNLSYEGGKQPRISHTGEFAVSVLKTYWGNGVGTKLIKYLIEWSRKSGVIRKINLRVRNDNLGAIHVYKSLGFTVEGVVTRDFLINSKFYDTICMGLAIE